MQVDQKFCFFLLTFPRIFQSFVVFHVKQQKYWFSVFITCLCFLKQKLYIMLLYISMCVVSMTSKFILNAINICARDRLKLFISFVYMTLKLYKYTQLDIQGNWFNTRYQQKSQADFVYKKVLFSPSPKAFGPNIDWQQMLIMFISFSDHLRFFLICYRANNQMQYKDIYDEYYPMKLIVSHPCLK